MPISAKVVLDSVQPDGVRLTTMEIVLPKFCLAQLNTHRSLSKNAASSRAVPIERVIHRVMNDPVIPIRWGKNQPGMQAREALVGTPAALSLGAWLMARDECVHRACQLLEHGVHKEIVNRLLEPWLYVPVLVSGTGRAWRHFFALRCGDEAQPEMATAAQEASLAHQQSTPCALRYGEWHLPYVQPDDRDVRRCACPSCVSDIYAMLRKISTARCARVSYLNHEGKRDLAKDIELHDRLLRPGHPPHASPFEHIAKAVGVGQGVHRHNPLSGNYEPGWVQYRKTLAGEFTE